MTVVKGLSNCCFSSNEFITKLPPNSLVSCVFFFIDFNKKANLEICWIVISGWRVVTITNGIAAAQCKHQTCLTHRRQTEFSRQRRMFQMHILGRTRCGSCQDARWLNCVWKAQPNRSASCSSLVLKNLCLSPGLVRTQAAVLCTWQGCRPNIVLKLRIKGLGPPGCCGAAGVAAGTCTKPLWCVGVSAPFRAERRVVPGPLLRRCCSRRESGASSAEMGLLCPVSAVTVTVLHVQGPAVAGLNVWNRCIFQIKMALLHAARPRQR